MFPPECGTFTIMEAHLGATTEVHFHDRGIHNCGADRKEERFHNCGAMTWHKANMKKEKEGVHENNAKELTGHVDNFSSPRQLMRMTMTAAVFGMTVAAARDEKPATKMIPMVIIWRLGTVRRATTVCLFTQVTRRGK